MIAIARSDGTAWLLNARTLDPIGQPFRMTATGNAESVAFSPNGRLLATAADDGTLRPWSLADPARPVQLSSVHDSGTYVYAADAGSPATPLPCPALRRELGHLQPGVCLGFVLHRRRQHVRRHQPAPASRDGDRISVMAAVGYRPIR